MSTFETSSESEAFEYEPYDNSYDTANGIYCQFCGSTPAVDATFRKHRGLLVMYQSWKLPGAYCRDCGLATFRQFTGDTMVQGWWGFKSFFITPFTLMMNLGERSQVSKLPPPIPGASQLPMDPGKPLTRRWHLLGLVLPVLAVVSLITAIANDSSDSKSTRNSGYPTYPSYPSTYTAPVLPYVPSIPSVPATTAKEPVKGSCVRELSGVLDESNPDPKLEVVPCDDPGAQAEVLFRDSMSLGLSEFACDKYPETDMVYTWTVTGSALARIQSYTLCLKLF